MTFAKSGAVLAPLLLLLACEPAATPPSPADTAQEPAAAPAPAPVVPAPPAASTQPDGVDDGAPDLTPPVLTPEAERSETGARNILLSFARAIELAEYGQAWALLGPADRQRWSAPAFAALFADLADVTVAVPGGTLGGADGARRYVAPVTVTGRDRDGRPVRLDGEARLRQDGEGSALRWRFDSLTLDWTH